MNSTIFEVLAIIALVLGNGFFAMSEFALISAKRSRIKNWAEKGDKRAIHTRKILQQPDRFLATIQVGITFISTMAGVFGGATIVHTLSPFLKSLDIKIISQSADPISIVVVVVFISFLSVVIGELVPKYMALRMPEVIAIRVTRPISIFSKLTFFLVNFLSFSARGILRLFGLSRLPESGHITEEEINILISEGTEKGIFDATEKKLIRSVFDFSDITVRQSMTPRIDVIGIQINWPTEKILETMTKYGYSRYPVYEESLDDIAGIVYTKDLISLMAKGEGLVLRDVVRRALFVPDSMPLTKLLGRFQKLKIHIAMVLDEFGGTAGLISLEDILEELVGEIQDEHDYEQAEFVAHSDTVAFASAHLRPDEVNSQFGTKLPEEEADTIGEMIVDSLGRTPQIGEEIEIEGLTFTVLELKNNWIKRVRIEKK